MLALRTSRPLASAPPAAWLQRQCACAGKGPCPNCDDEQRDALQAKSTLAIGASHDPLEREADAAAERVLRGEPAGVGRAAQARFAQRRSTGVAGPASAPPAVHDTLASAGRALPLAVRGWAESRFGHDFSQVRIHDDGAARASAAAVQASAYTVGSHLVFGSAFDGESTEGRRLLAHELAHVVQQGRGEPLVQRQGQPAAGGKTDVAIVLTDSEQDMAEGGAYARTVLRVTSVEDAAAKLKALGVPIGRLFVVSHSSASGELQFVGASGGVTMVPIRTFAAGVQGLVEHLDFRGCNIGKAPEELDRARTAAGASSAVGSTCYTLISRLGPMMLGGVPLTQRSQVRDEQRAELDAAMLQRLAEMRSANGRAVQNCLVGLARGESVGRSTLPKIWEAYWNNRGNLVATWASPENNDEWQQGSLCTKDQTATSQPCARVEKKKAPP